MKVLSYLEFGLLGLSQKVDYYEAITPRKDYPMTTGVKREHNAVLESDLNQWYAKKVSQPFTPQLITELFEGWEYDGVLKDEIGDGEGGLIETRYFDNWHFNGFNDDISIYKEQNMIQYGLMPFPIPCVLDSFITDCQRAGIELQWRY
jgi:hypothetical protein